MHADEHERQRETTVGGGGAPPGAARPGAGPPGRRDRARSTPFETTFRCAPIGMAVGDARSDGVVLLRRVNPQMCRLLGRPADALRGATVASLAAGEVTWWRRRITTLVDGEADSIEVDLALRHTSGERIPVTVVATLLDDGSAGPPPRRVVVQVVDRSERRRHRRELRRLAHVDALTGLGNRRRFDADLDDVAARARRLDRPATLVLLDLDDFQGVNDAHGSRCGDQLLVAVADVLRTHVGEHDALARRGGDEFALALHGADVADALVVVEAIRTAVIAVGISCDRGRTARTSASFGLTPLVTGVSTSTALAEAACAMRRAKRAGGDRAIVAPRGSRESSASDGRGWSQRLRHALEHDEFTLLAQPLLDLRSGEVTRHELLLRLVGDDGELISPGEFLPTAERHGVVHAIDRWVVDRAVDELERWADAGGARAGDVLHVNLSGSTISDERTVDRLVERVTTSRIDPSRLLFELTETAGVADVGAARRSVERLAACGCGVGLDDVGSGFGSLSYLKRFPVDLVKIDGEHVRGLASSAVDQLIVRAITEIGIGMGKDVVAEFVADEASLELLRGIGVRWAQGYHVGPPRPLEELSVEVLEAGG